MKRTALFILTLVMLGSCVEYEARPVYDERDNLVGYYEMEEYSTTYREYISYEILVTKSSYSRREIYLNDFYAVNTRVYAFVDHGRITIPVQITNGYEIEGSGRVYAGDLHLDYRVTDLQDHGFTDYCESVAYFN